MKRILVVLGFLSVIPAHSQIRSGTIVVFGQTGGRFVIAADSRVAFDNRPPEDNQCKIAASKTNRIVFAATGPVGYTNQGGIDLAPTWNAFDDAKTVVLEEWADPKPDTAAEAAGRLARAWEKKILDRWNTLQLLNPQAFNQAIDHTHGRFTTGIFAIAYKGQIAFTVSAIVSSNNVLTIQRPDADCSNGVDLCASGQTDVFTRYTSQKPFMIYSDQMAQVIKLADLTTTEDTTGTVHGPIDALELLSDGTISWKQKKENCLDSQD
jgi:hypothetical protein